MTESDRLKRSSFVAGGLATVALLIFLGMFTSARFTSPVLWIAAVFVWVLISAWFYKIELDVEAKRRIIDKF